MDTNREQVTFARPDLEHLRIFCNEKFGWPFNKTDELMVPVLKVCNPPSLLTPFLHSLALSQTQFEAVKLAS